MATTLETLTQLLNKKGIPHEVDREFVDLTANTKTQALSQVFEDPRWLEWVKNILFAVSIGGSVVLAGSGQIPTSVAISASSASMYLNQINRNRSTQSAQQNGESSSTMIEASQNTAADINTLIERLNSAESSMVQVKKNMLTRTHLAPIVSKVQQLGRKQFILEKTVVPQVAELQQGFAELTQSLNPMRQRPTLLPGQRGRLAIFIDGSNLHYSSKDEGVQIDYAKLLEQLKKGSSELVGTFYYTGINPNNLKQPGFLEDLRRLGYKINGKEVMQHANGLKEVGIDVDLALKMATLAAQYDTAVLVSGDADLTGAVEYARQQGARVEIVSFLSTTSKALIKAADQFTDIRTLPVIRNNVNSAQSVPRPLLKNSR